MSIYDNKFDMEKCTEIKEGDILTLVCVDLGEGRFMYIPADENNAQFVAYQKQKAAS